MKRLVFLVLCLCLTAEAAPSSIKKSRHGQPSAASSRVARRPPVAVPPASPWVVDIHELVPSLRPMPQKEREDQLRDWALYGLLMHLRLDAHALARTTHQLSPVRLSYLEELFAFDYGRGRRAILSDERVLLLYEQSDPDPQATLGRLADRVRMEMGTVPQRFELYTFDADVTKGELHLKFQEAVPGSVLFSQAYGYQEAVVSDQAGMAQWVDAIDDVVSAKQVKEGLQLGGRRFAKSRTRGATLEDVAALYQAHSSLAKQQQQRQHLVEKLKAQVRRDLDSAVLEEVRHSFSMFPRDQQAQQQELDRRMKDRAESSMRAGLQALPRAPPEPGFSLDPRIDEPGLVASLEGLAEDPCRELQELRDKARASFERLKDTKALPGTIFHALGLFNRDIADIRMRCQLLAEDPTYSQQLQRIAVAARGLLSGDSEEEALGPFYSLKNELKDSTDETHDFLWRVLSLAMETHRRQCARYDGPLGGTRVGMNLFYTDLLAKLWALDVNNEAPALRVPGFVSMARLPPSPYREEDLKKLSTRLWFGPRKEAYTRSQDSAELRFQQVATRVFAAGSNPDQAQRQEGTPNEHSRRAIGWWEQHFADVADYEQEYHLQNQIMKWSVITGFLRERQLASYLAQVPVARTEQFSQWYEKTRAGLKYQLPLLVEGEAGHECMDILSSQARLSGGVTLSGGTLSQVPVVMPKGPASLRHGLKSMTGGKPVAEELGRAFSAHVSPGIIRVEPLATTRARSQAVQLELGPGPVELVHASTRPGDYQLTLSTSRVPVGHFHGTDSMARTTLRWKSGQVGEALQLAHAATQSGEAVRVLVETVGAPTSSGQPSRLWHSVVRGPGNLEVQIPSATGKQFTRVQISNGFSEPLEGLSGGESLLARYDWQRFEVPEGTYGFRTSQAVNRLAERAGPSAGASSVWVLGVEGFPQGLLVVVAKGGALYAPKPALSSAIQSWYDLDQTAAFTPRDLVKIREAARRGESTIERHALSNARAEQEARALAGGDGAGLTRQPKAPSPQRGPAPSPAEVRSHLEGAADLHLAQGRAAEASRLYDMATAHFGEASPSVLIKQTLASTASGKSAPEALDAVVARYALKLPLEERVQVIRTAQGLKDMPDVADVLQARMELRGSIPRDVEPSIHLENDGPDVVSAYHSEKPLQGEPIGPDEFKQGVPKDATFYVEDGFSFNKNDFQANPAENVAELGRNPAVEVTRLRKMPTGTYRPGKIYAKQEAALALSAERALRRVAGPSSGDESLAPIYRIRPLHLPSRDSPCDTNKDGTVSEEERLQCEAA